MFLKEESYFKLIREKVDWSMVHSVNFQCKNNMYSITLKRLKNFKEIQTTTLNFVLYSFFEFHVVSLPPFFIE